MATCTKIRRKVKIYSRVYHFVAFCLIVGLLFGPQVLYLQFYLDQSLLPLILIILTSVIGAITLYCLRKTPWNIVRIFYLTSLYNIWLTLACTLTAVFVEEKKLAIKINLAILVAMVIVISATENYVYLRTNKRCLKV